MSLILLLAQIVIPSPDTSIKLPEPKMDVLELDVPERVWKIPRDPVTDPISYREAYESCRDFGGTYPIIVYAPGDEQIVNACMEESGVRRPVKVLVSSYTGQFFQGKYGKGTPYLTTLWRRQYDKDGKLPTSVKEITQTVVYTSGKLHMGAFLRGTSNHKDVAEFMNRNGRYRRGGRIRTELIAPGM